MNVFIMLAITLANIIAILLVYQFIKKLPKMEKIIFIGVSFAIIYVLVSIIYWISGFGIEEKINEVAKDFITFTFVPVNVILLVPFIASKYNKLRFKEIGKNEFIKRLVIMFIVGIIILSIECVYFKNVKSNIKLLNDNKVEEQQENNEASGEIENSNIISNEVYTNEISVNITNTEVVNETTNSVLVNEESNVVNGNYLE